MNKRRKLRGRGARRRPPVALMVALLALFVALGGGATAAGKVLLTGKDIKNGSITGKDIRNKSIGPADLNARALSLLQSKATLAQTPVRGAPGAKGPRGFKGEQGAKGVKGEAGANCYDQDPTKKKLYTNYKPKNPMDACQGPRGPKGDKGDRGKHGRTGIPAGAVMSFNLESCPKGWNPLVDAQGRAIVGLPDGGTLAGTVGDPLADLTPPTHTHDVDPAAVASSTSGDHTHADTFEVAEDGLHGHPFSGVTLGDGAFADVQAGAGVSSNTFSHTHSFSGVTDDAGAHTHVLDGAVVTDGSHDHQVDVLNTTSANGTTGDTIPYIQLLTCEKA